MAKTIQEMEETIQAHKQHIEMLSNCLSVAHSQIRSEIANGIYRRIDYLEKEIERLETEVVLQKYLIA